MSGLAIVLLAAPATYAQPKINGLPWFAVLKMQRWQQKSADPSKSIYLMFDNHRYFIVRGKNDLIDQGRLGIAKKGTRFNLHNRYGRGYLDFSNIKAKSFNVDGVLTKRFTTQSLKGTFVPVDKPLVPPVAADLYQAAKYGDLVAVKKYLKAGSAIDGKNASSSPLAAAATHHHTRVVAYLLKQGAKADLKDKGGLTPLAHAVQCSDVESAQALIKAGANVNLKNNESVSLLFRAFERDSFPMVKLLIKSGADVNTLDKSGFTAIHRAMSVFSLQDSKIVERLDYTRYMIEKAGYDPKVKDKHGRTVLFYAANLGLEKTVKYLLGKGVSPYIKDKSGKDVFEYIKESEYHDKIKPVLMKAKKTGADKSASRLNTRLVI